MRVNESVRSRDLPRPMRRFRNVTDFRLGTTCAAAGHISITGYNLVLEPASLGQAPRSDGFRQGDRAPNECAARGRDINASPKCGPLWGLAHAALRRRPRG